MGYVEAKGNVYYFALNIQKRSTDKNERFADARIHITNSILKELSIR